MSDFTNRPYVTNEIMGKKYEHLRLWDPKIDQNIIIILVAVNNFVTLCVLTSFIFPVSTYP